MAKAESHGGELFPRVGFIVTDLNTPSRDVPLLGAADKAVNLVGCKSPHHQLPVFGWLAISDACGGNEAFSARIKASAAQG